MHTIHYWSTEGLRVTVREIITSLTANEKAIHTALLLRFVLLALSHSVWDFLTNRDSTNHPRLFVTLAGALDPFNQLQIANGTGMNHCEKWTWYSIKGYFSFNACSYSDWIPILVQIWRKYPEKWPALNYWAFLFGLMGERSHDIKRNSIFCRSISSNQITS